MIFDTSGNEPIISSHHEILRGVLGRWYIRHHDNCSKPPITECDFWLEIRVMQQDGTLGKMWPVIPLRVKEFLKKRWGYVWYQDDVSLAEDRLVVTFQFGTTGRNKSKYPNMIYKKQWMELEKEVRKKVINTSDTKEVAPLER